MTGDLIGQVGIVTAEMKKAQRVLRYFISGFAIGNAAMRKVQ